MNDILQTGTLGIDLLCKTIWAYLYLSSSSQGVQAKVFPLGAWTPFYSSRRGGVGFCVFNIYLKYLLNIKYLNKSFHSNGIWWLFDVNRNILRYGLCILMCLWVVSCRSIYQSIYLSLDNINKLKSHVLKYY